MAPEQASMAEAGHAHPVGAQIADGGVNFSVFAENADGVELLLFERPTDPEPARVLPLARDFHFWHAFVPDVEAGTTYAFRASGPSGAPFRFDRQKVLLDPYARIVVTSLWDRGKAAQPGDNVATSLRATVFNPSGYYWEGDRPLERPLSETIVYELHVGGFTPSPTSEVAASGTFAGVREKIPHLVDLGVTAVELLPVFQFDPTDGDFWGYNPIAHFAPHDRYGSVDDFRDLVKALHRAGLEVILDVVFNHTGEAGSDGPTISLRGFGNEAYYMISPRDPSALLDFSGCGNTLDVNDPITSKLVFDCLCYWVEQLHVDGFRFDEGTVLTRDETGAPMKYPPVVALTELADQLGGTKLIAEAWDAGGLYEVGAFPGRRWSEWNGRFRDDVRRFVRGDPGLVAAVATRIAGSSDLYQWSRRPPLASVNFVTCHDGFTLNDLVSYDVKHNDANGEGNRDGSNDNLSWNCGLEGETADPAVEGLRERQIRNFAVILLVSQGVPMILAGDEARRTQRGNNNAWNQANEISWVDWDCVAANDPLRRFWKLLIDFRKRHRSLRRDSFFEGARNERGVADVQWHGCLVGAPGWYDSSSRVLSFTLGGFDGENDVHVILNMSDADLDFEVPAIGGRAWGRAFDTSLSSPEDASEPGTEPRVAEDGIYRAGARSASVLVSRPL
jgi:glycogen operon protein